MKKFIVIATGTKTYAFDLNKVSVHRLNTLYNTAKNNGLRWNVEFLGC